MNDPENFTRTRDHQSTEKYMISTFSRHYFSRLRTHHVWRGLYCSNCERRKINPLTARDLCRFCRYSSPARWNASISAFFVSSAFPPDQRGACAHAEKTEEGKLKAKATEVKTSVEHPSVLVVHLSMWHHARLIDQWKIDSQELSIRLHRKRRQAKNNMMDMGFDRKP